MQNLTRASDQLFSRTPDECFPTLSALAKRCHEQQEKCQEVWQPPKKTLVSPDENGGLDLSAGEHGAFTLNDWSFSQLCRLAGVGKETVNRLTPETASRVFGETLPAHDKPLQLYVQGDRLRSLHAASYTRLFNSHVLSVVQEFATDFEPPQKGFNGATGLYAGEQDMFAFLIDPAGWTDIGGEAFAPGFFVWNSEVGSRSVGIETFWFQAVCQNHIVWDAVEVVEFTRKHTRNVHEALSEIRRIIEALVEKRDERRDGFVRVIEKAMETRLGDDADEVKKVLHREGIPRQLAKKALEVAEQQGALTVFALVDALTRLCREKENAGDRTAADQQVSRLLNLAVA